MVDLVANPAVLKAYAPFSALGDAELAILFPAVQQKTHARYARIVRVRDGAAGVHVVISGSAELLMHDADGRELTLEILGPGDFFSELELSAGGPEMAVVARERCESYFVSARDFRTAMRGNSAVMQLLYEHLSARLRQAHSALATLAFLDVRARVAHALLDLAVPVQRVWTVREGSEQIARRVAASREMVSRVLKQLREEGLISRAKRRTFILDRERLADVPRLQGGAARHEDLTDADRRLAPEGLR